MLSTTCISLTIFRIWIPAILQPSRTLCAFRLCLSRAMEMLNDSTCVGSDMTSLLIGFRYLSTIAEVLLTITPLFPCLVLDNSMGEPSDLWSCLRADLEDASLSVNPWMVSSYTVLCMTRWRQRGTRDRTLSRLATSYSYPASQRAIVSILAKLLSMASDSVSSRTSSGWCGSYRRYVVSCWVSCLPYYRRPVH